MRKISDLVLFPYIYVFVLETNLSFRILFIVTQFHCQLNDDVNLGDLKEIGLQNFEKVEHERTRNVE
jgi:hypothetical protein